MRVAVCSEDGSLRRITRALLAMLVMANGACSQRTEANPVGPAKPAQLTIGTVTHFGQHWPQAVMATVDATAAPVVRDGLSWKQIEPTPGHYTFDAANSGFIDELCRRQRKVLIVLQPFNPAYEPTLPVRAPESMAAFGAFAGAVADRFAPCLAGIEIGNEINGAGGKSASAGADDVQSYVSLLRQVQQAVRPRHPELPLIGVSVHSIALGYIAKLLDAGALDLIDGIAVHPYRRDPANVDLELNRLHDLIATYGRPVPIWVTEFGIARQPTHEAAIYMAKMVALMSAAGVAKAQWYAQIEEPAFPGMGLYDRDLRPKETARTLNYLNREVLSHGPAERRFVGQTDVSIFTFGGDRMIVWGEPGRRLSITGHAVARSITGEAIAMPEVISAEPFVIEGMAKVTLGPRAILADSLLDYGRLPWTYSAIDGRDRAETLGFVDTRFGSFVGDARRRLTVNQTEILMRTKAPAVPQLVMRYVATESGALFAGACLRQIIGPPLSLRILQNDEPMGLSVTSIGEAVTSIVKIAVRAGDRIDFALSGEPAPPNAILGYRLRIARGGEAPSCPALSPRGQAILGKAGSSAGGIQAGDAQPGDGQAD